MTIHSLSLSLSVFATYRTAFIALGGVELAVFELRTKRYVCKLYIFPYWFAGAEIRTMAFGFVVGRAFSVCAVVSHSNY